MEERVTKRKKKATKNKPKQKKVKKKPRRKNSESSGSRTASTGSLRGSHSEGRKSSISAESRSDSFSSSPRPKRKKRRTKKNKRKVKRSLSYSSTSSSSPDPNQNIKTTSGAIFKANRSGSADEERILEIGTLTIEENNEVFSAKNKLFKILGKSEFEWKVDLTTQIVFDGDSLIKRPSFLVVSNTQGQLSLFKKGKEVINYETPAEYSNPISLICKKN